MPSDLQRDMVAPERLLVGHPFNPVYLLPLVELVGGKLTQRRASQRRVTSTPISACIRSPAPRGAGTLDGSLQEALWRNPASGK